MLLLFFISILLTNYFTYPKSEQSAQLFLQKSSKSSSKHAWNFSLILKAFCRKTTIFENLKNVSRNVFKSLSALALENSSLEKIFLKNWCSLKMIKSAYNILLTPASKHLELISSGKWQRQQRSCIQLIGCFISFFFSSLLSTKLFDLNFLLSHFSRKSTVNVNSVEHFSEMAIFLFSATAKS